MAHKWTEIEKKWQDAWEKQEVFRAYNPSELKQPQPKFYCLDMFPYPSGDGLHVGHPLGYIATDILCRYKRMRGYNVLHPMGWDAFGLPAEQYAIQKGVHPEITTKKNIETFKKQLRSLGLSFDWNREINTSAPSYYKWTQWIFKQMLKRGLAYQAEVAVNWCPALGTVLANDEVIDGKSERGGHPVERRPMRQWMMKITSYAERLLQDLDKLDWPESTKELQRNWIGKSEGARIHFSLSEDPAQGFEVFTTRPDTLMGVTFMVLAPEHRLVESLCSSELKEGVLKYVEEAKKKNDLQRTDLNKNKTGVFTGGYVRHPLTEENIPVWVADYVLISYGAGAIMGVPAHDERDGEFATTFDLPVLPVIDENGKLINSDVEGLRVNGLDYKVAAKAIIKHLEAKSVGKAEVQYKLRDWIFSRQRYWGEPIPVVHHKLGAPEHSVSLLNDADLPLTLPSVESYKPTGSGESPLAALSDWVQCQDETGRQGQRETNTMPGSAGSSWYFLRYMDPKNDKEAWSKQAEAYWGPVDFYMGGAEHAVGHLLYSRFWHKVFFDMGLVTHPEPFQKLFHQGLMLGEDGEKMSKSRGNVVNPDKVIEEYGSDTFRLFEMFLGPIEKAKPWQMANIEGVYRFLSRYWRFCYGEESTELRSDIVDIAEGDWPKELVILFHQTIKSVTEDYENLRLNTAISGLMILLNEAYNHFLDKPVPRSFLETFNLLLAPMAPHITEEIWEKLGHDKSTRYAQWPSYDPTKAVSDRLTLAVQVNGKVRDNIEVAKGTSEDEIRKVALASEKVQKWIEGKDVRKFIYVKEKLVSIVV
jgi:leucyl-tRNA synthetase